MTGARKSDKKLMAMRLSGEARAVLTRLAKKTGKSKTRVTEEALLLQGKMIGLDRRAARPPGSPPDQGGPRGA